MRWKHSEASLKRWVFKWYGKATILFDDLKYSGDEFQRVGAAAGKGQVPAWALTLGTDNKWKLDEWSVLDSSTRESVERMKILTLAHL